MLIINSRKRLWKKKKVINIITKFFFIIIKILNIGVGLSFSKDLLSNNDLVKFYSVLKSYLSKDSLKIGIY